MKIQYLLQILNGRKDLDEGLYKGYNKDNCKRHEEIHGIGTHCGTRRLYDDWS